jgi:hypothetical protein
VQIRSLFYFEECCFSCVLVIFMLVSFAILLLSKAKVVHYKYCIVLILMVTVLKDTDGKMLYDVDNTIYFVRQFKTAKMCILRKMVPGNHVFSAMDFLKLLLAYLPGMFVFVPGNLFYIVK